MKHLLAALLCLLLCGCAQDPPAAETTVPEATTAETAPTAPSAGLYEAGSPWERKFGGALRAYPLHIPDTTGMRAMEDGLLVFSGTDATTLTLLTGDKLYVTASVPLDFVLDPDDPSLRIGNGALSFFDPEMQETVVLNETLKEVSRIAVTEDLSGSPILSDDRNTLYYCTSTSICAWDLETGIHRTVKELSYDEQALTGLHLEDTVLQCRIRDGSATRTLFLAADTGRLLYEQDGEVSLVTEGERYYASFPTGKTQALLFGEGEAAPTALIPDKLSASCHFSPAGHAAVTAFEGDKLTLEYYDLASGRRYFSLPLDTRSPLLDMETTDAQQVYILLYDDHYGCETIYRWDVPTPAGNTSDYVVWTGTYYTAADPDQAGLAQCLSYAAEIGSKYGITVRVWEDALTVQPWDYEFEAEYLYPVIMQELTMVDQSLAQFPEGVLEKTVSHFSSLTISLVRQITGTAQSGSLSTATGIQFFEDTDAYVVIALGEYSEQSLFHELFHVMETHILTESTALDQWEELNPPDFEYDYDYAVNSTRDTEIYLKGDTRSFVDTYSMCYPKEDRARIMENAILPENEAMFESKAMQAKLTALCQGIREAYGLKKSGETFLWEQYLENPLAYAQ